MDDLSTQVGGNIRRIRRGHGIALADLADASGLSKSFLSRVERGERHVDRRSHLDALANALSCSIGTLIGGPTTAGGATQQVALATVPQLRRALRSAEIDYVDRTAAIVPIEILRARAMDLWNARRACDYAKVAALLPHLVQDLYLSSKIGPDRDHALRLYVEVCSAAAFSLRGLNHGDLAWIAAQQCCKAAQDLDDPIAIGFAEFTRSHASVLETGYASALHIAEQAADAIRPYLSDDDPEAARVYGTLLLTAAWGASVAGNKSQIRTYVDEAAAVGDRVGDPLPEGDAWQTYFGPTNTRIWQMTIVVEAGEGGKVVDLARDADLSVIDSKSRQAEFWTQFGCGIAQEHNRENVAVDAILKANRLAAQRTRNNPHVRAAVSSLLDRSYRHTSRQLLGLARYVGAMPSN
ncbi:MAG: helix-turn-helix domain-containing protein [Pseudonocardia sp.]